MENTLAFLDLILPDEGWRCAFVQQEKRNYFFQTNAELATFILQWDAAGYTVYHACASYKDPAGQFDERTGKQKYRGHGNVARLASLWSDIDAGPGKAYPDANAATWAVDAACQTAGLPAPLYVCSGRGIHVYWPLDCELVPAVWRSYAVGLREVLRRAQLHIDPARTADASSILRTPGTHNRKEGLVLPVIMGPLIEPYQIELFDYLLEHSDARVQREQITTLECPPWLDRPRPSLTFHINSDFLASSSSSPIAEQCAQLGEFRRTQGVIAEPLWHAGLGVLAFTRDGDRYAHEWSAGHRTYSAAETNERLDRLRQLSGATTCEKFHSLEPSLCEACPHWQKIKSPISLGFSERAEPAGTEAGAPKTSAATPAKASEQVGLPPLPRHFAWRGMSLVFQTENAGQPVEHLISTYPIFLHGVNEAETRGDFSLTFRQWLPSKGWFDFHLGHKELMRPQGVAELATYGANIHEASHFIKYVKTALDQHYETNKLRIRYDQYGWKANNTAFLYGKKLYTTEGAFDVAGSKELETRNQWIGPGAAVKGNPESFGIERWTQAANSLFAAGCEAQSVALLASFAAVLMRFLDTLEGGAIISLVTHESASGKTVALAGAASVWGTREGLSLTSDDNKVTKWLTLGAMGNLPVVHDEFQNRDPVAVKDFVVNFTNGRDKMRGTRGGEIRHSASTWQTLLVTASNTSLVETLEIASKADAQSWRVLELNLEIPEHLKHIMGDKLKNELLANAGYAGEIFIQRLLKPKTLEWVKAALDKASQDIWAKTKLDQKYRFWVRATTGIAVAGMLVNDLKILNFSTDRIVNWLIDKISKGKKGFRGPFEKTGDWAADALARFILTENINFLVIATQWKRGMPRIRPLREPRNKLAGCFAIAERKLTIPANALHSYAVENEFSFREWHEILHRRGCASMVSRAQLTAGTDLPGAQMNCVEFDMAHPTLAGADSNLSIQPGDDKTNVTPFQRK